MTPLKFILVSNQLLLRRAMACFINSQLQWETIAEEKDLRPALALAQKNKGCLLIIDAEYPEIEIGLAVNEARLIGAHLVVFSCQNNVKKLASLLPYHANGYLTADSTPIEFKRHIIEVVKGKHALSESLIKELISEISGDAIYDEFLIFDGKKITAREKDILKCLCTGATNRQIADSLVISEYTVKNHVHNMLEKLKFNNRTELISYAINNGLV